MIIPSRISEIYDSLRQGLDLFRKEMDPVLRRIANNCGGFFDSRVKEKTSFAQKLETGRFSDYNEIIDLYGAIIVVATHKEIDLIKKEVLQQFEILKAIENRPKEYSSFIYDDLHLHIKYKPQVLVPGKEYLLRPFELQVKTFLQHGWAKATHDILYKGNQMSWPRFRIAYQIKVMLEQSDQILGQIDKAADLCPNNSFDIFTQKTKILELMKNKWDTAQLPSNLTGLVDEVFDVLRICKKQVSFFEQELISSQNRNILSAQSITPFQAILGILIKADFKSLCKGFKEHRRSIILTQELKDILGVIPAQVLELTKAI